MEGTERSSLQAVLGTHSAEQGAERPEVLHMVDWVGQTGQLADVRFLGCRERGFLDQTNRTSAAVLKLPVGMGLDASGMGSQTHHERLHHERDFSKDLVAVIAMDHQRECGWERSERGSCLFESERSPSTTASAPQECQSADEVAPQWPVEHKWRQWLGERPAGCS